MLWKILSTYTLFADNQMKWAVLRQRRLWQLSSSLIYGLPVILLTQVVFSICFLLDLYLFCEASTLYCVKMDCFYFSSYFNIFYLARMVKETMIFSSLLNLLFCDKCRVSLTFAKSSGAWYADFTSVLALTELIFKLWYTTVSYAMSLLLNIKSLTNASLEQHT